MVLGKSFQNERHYVRNTFSKLPERLESYLNKFPDYAKRMREIRSIHVCSNLQQDLNKRPQCNNERLINFNPDKRKLMKYERKKKLTPLKMLRQQATRITQQKGPRSRHNA